MKAISLHTLRSRHPYIDDPDAESARVEEETIEEALLQGLANQAAQGAIPVTYLAMIEKYRRKEPDLVQAILKADAEMKAEQAKMAPPPEQGQFAAPQQMPGLSGPPPMPPNMPPEMAAAMAGGPPPPEGQGGPPISPQGQGGPPMGAPGQGGAGPDLQQLLSALQAPAPGAA
jgi:hypothetical protein